MTTSPSAAQRLTRPALFDAHCHIHDPRLNTHSQVQLQQQQQYEALRPVVSRAAAANVTHLVSCACFEADWDALDALLACWNREFNSTASAKHTNSSSTDGESGGDKVLRAPIMLVPSFGVHPWWAQERRDDYLELLRAMLQQHPSASLGEIGLCKSSRGRAVEFHTQEQVFRSQLGLAAELSRACVIHCVGYYSKLLEIFQTTLSAKKQLPPRIVLHSYAGGADLAKAFLALEKKAAPNSTTRIFFSLNVKQLTDSRSDKTAACCAAIPLRALLLETDAPDQAPLAIDVERACEEADKEEGGGWGFEFEATLLGSSSSGELNEPALVSVAYLRAAKIRGLPLAELVAAVYENSLTAFGLMEE